MSLAKGSTVAAESMTGGLDVSGVVEGEFLVESDEEVEFEDEAIDDAVGEMRRAVY